MARLDYVEPPSTGIKEFDDMIKEIERQICAAMALPADTFRSLSKVYDGAKVKIIDKNTGEVLFDGDGSFTLNLPKPTNGHSFTIQRGKSECISAEVGDVSGEPRWKRACNHDIKIYDSGFTRERYCTKCTWKEKI